MNEDWDEELDAPFIWDDGTVTTLRKVMGTKLPFEADESSPDYVSPFFDSPLYNGPKEFDHFTQRATSPISAHKGNGKYEYLYNFQGFSEVGEMIQNYKQYEIDPYQLTFLYESKVEGKSNFFGTFVLAKCGTKIKEYFKNIIVNLNVKGGILYHETLHNYKGMHGLAKTYSKLFQIDTKLKVSELDMQMLLTRELGIYDRYKVFFDLDEKLADWLKEGATALEEWKFKKEDYTPKNNTPEQPIFGKDFIKQAANIIDPFFPDELIQGFIQMHAKLLAKIADLIMPEDMRAFLQSIIDKVKLSIDKVQESMQLLANWSVEVLHLGKAFLMGVANGFISLIQTLLYIISFIIDSIYGFTEGFDNNKAINGEWYMKARSIMESMEDGMDWLSDNFTKIFDTVKHLIQTFDKEALAEFFHNLYNSVVNKVKALTKYDLAYFCGSAVFEIIIGVAITILTGGGAVAAKIAANTATKAELAAAQAAARLETSRAWLKLIGREAISTVTFGLYDFFKFITHLLDKFIEEGLKGFKSFLQFLRNLLTKSGDEVVEVVDDIKAGVKNKLDEISKEAEKLPLPEKVAYSTFIPPLTPLQQRWLNAATKLFYKDLKKVFLKYSDELFVKRQWHKARFINEISNEDLEELLAIRNLKKVFNNKNVAKLKLRVEVDGEIIDQDFFAIAGKNVNADGSSFTVEMNKYLTNWDMSDEQVRDMFFDNSLKVPRYHDSEHKMLDDVNEFILNLQARYGKHNVKVNSMHIKTLYEPCIICKKQILIYKNVHNIAEVSVSATKRNSRQYVQNNEHLKELINNIK
ncbi:MAG: hypothetical protein K1X55_16835 [Chitinophagales bacterium]|nr:hypothetical protein [Chitinophagales bacterium]